MRLQVILAAMALAAAPGVAISQPKTAKAVAPSLPPAVTAYLRDFQNQCRESGGAMPLPKAVDIPQADLTGDGKVEYLVSNDLFQCSLGASFFTGNGFTDITVFDGANLSPTAQPILAQQGHQGFEVSKAAPSKLTLVVEGADCGQRVATGRGGREYCERDMVWDAAVRQLKFAPLRSKRPVRDGFGQ